MTSFSQQPHLHADAPFRAAQLTYPGNLQEALRQAQEDAKKTLFGVAHGIPSVFLTKVLASTKPDFIWIDVEHGMFNRLTLHDAIHAAQHHSEGKSMVIVRVPKHDEISLTTALDAGAAGIVIPHCESAKDVTDMLKEIYYRAFLLLGGSICAHYTDKFTKPEQIAPLGHRSFSPWVFTPGVSDASLYPNDAFNIQTSNRHIAIIPQIESVKGIDNAEEIAAVEGVSAIMFGPGDYMCDAGIPLQLGGVPDPRFLEAMGKFSAAGAKYNRPLMGGAQSMDMIPMMVQSGYRAICTVFDVWGIAAMVHGSLATAREFVQEKGVPVMKANGQTNGITQDS